MVQERLDVLHLAGKKIINNEHFVPEFYQFFDNMRTDKTGPAGYNIFHDTVLDTFPENFKAENPDLPVKLWTEYYLMCFGENLSLNVLLVSFTSTPLHTLLPPSGPSPVSARQ
jgi:hypothetical protein